jgi:hypothetical protein
MITSGLTRNKLDIIRTYSLTQPYVLGVNGVTDIKPSPSAPISAITSVSYTIDDINYVTYLNNSLTTFFYNNYSGQDFEPFLNTQNGQNTFDIKEESKMKLVFPPKVTNDLFIERMELAVFEKHSRLSNIKNLEQLENYKNGYYKITKIN